MARIACLVCLVSTVGDHSKYALGRGSATSGHTTRLEQFIFCRYLWVMETWQADECLISYLWWRDKLVAISFVYFL